MSARFLGLPRGQDQRQGRSAERPRAVERVEPARRGVRGLGPAPEREAGGHGEEDDPDCDLRNRDCCVLVVDRIGTLSHDHEGNGRRSNADRPGNPEGGPVDDGSATTEDEQHREDR
jgi:hypothetical protein